MRFSLVRYASLPSSMDAAGELADRGAPEGTTVVAAGQTAGRGRAGHAWFSPAGDSLYVSIVLRPPVRPDELGWVTMAAALAARQAVLRLTAPCPLPVAIKWFNDVLLGGRKVCGILVETSITGDRVDHAVLGIGLNVNADFEAAPAEVRARATSLRQALGRACDCDQALEVLLAQFDAQYSAVVQRRSSPAAEYARHVETLGRPVSIDTGGQVVAGVAEWVNPDGSLVVRTAAGDRVVRYGDAGW